MKPKTLVIATVLVASLGLASTAQAHDDFGYPVGLMSGVLIGLSLDHGDHYYSYRDRPRRHYYHREYRRHDSHGYQQRDRYKRHHRRHNHRRHHGRD
ncbi:MAG: hypothetical protein P8166_04260 [Candidatus Thiodiazotropha sp.]|jgi:hypothetical protein